MTETVLRSPATRTWRELVAAANSAGRERRSRTAPDHHSHRNDPANSILSARSMTAPSSVRAGTARRSWRPWNCATEWRRGCRLRGPTATATTACWCPTPLRRAAVTALAEPTATAPPAPTAKPASGRAARCLGAVPRPLLCGVPTRESPPRRRDAPHRLDHRRRNCARPARPPGRADGTASHCARPRAVRPWVAADAECVAPGPARAPDGSACTNSISASPDSQAPACPTRCVTAPLVPAARSRCARGQRLVAVRSECLPPAVGLA